MPKEEFLTDAEKAQIKALNDIRYLLESGIAKFIPKKRRHLVSITKEAYPIKIKY